MEDNKQFTINIGDKEVIIHKYPTMGGLEIMIKFGTCFLPNSNYEKFEECVILLMKHVGLILHNGVETRIMSKEMIDKYFTMEEVVSILHKSLDFNSEWFSNSIVISYFKKAMERVKGLLPSWIEKFIPFVFQIIEKTKQSKEAKEHVDS